MKKEKKRLAAIALASPENSSSSPEEHVERRERPRKKKKPKLQEARQENGMEDPPVSLAEPKKKKSFSKEGLISSDLEERAGSGSFPTRKNSFPRGEPGSDPEEAENRSLLSFKEEPLSSGPEEAAGSKNGSSKRKRRRQKPSQGA